MNPALENAGSRFREPCRDDPPPTARNRPMIESAVFSLDAYSQQMRTRVDRALDGVHVFRPWLPRRARRGDPLQPAGAGQAVAADAGAAGGRELRRLGRGGAAGGLRRRDGARLFADPRRPACDGRRRPAPRPADLPQGVRRGDGDPGRRRPVDPGFRECWPATCGRPRWRPNVARCWRMRPAPAQLVGGQADDLAGQLAGGGVGGARSDPPPQDRRDVPGFARAGRAGRRRRAPSSATRLESTAAGWAWPFRSPTTCSTCAATRPRMGKRVGKDRTAAN